MASRPLMIFGVMIITSSSLLFTIDSLLKAYPKRGISPKSGTLEVSTPLSN